MTKRENFQALQRRLAAHLRDPEHNSPPEGLEDRRMEVYRSLFFNNMLGFISGAFPVLKQLYGEEDWRTLVRGFYSQHESHSPYFSDISKEFVAYLENEHRSSKNDPPFLAELAHYEWVEIALSMAEEDTDADTIDPGGDLLNEPPALSPLAWRLTYRWPVHRIGPDFRPTEPGDEPTRLAVCRGQDDKVRFIALNPATDLLLDEIERHPQRTGREQVEAVAKKLRMSDLDAAQKHGAETLRQLRDKDILLGTRLRGNNGAK